MTTSDAGRRVAVVTGASSGIGDATARTLAAQGFHVVVLARRAELLNALAAEIGGSAIVADVTDDAAIEALADSLDRIDVLVNNAGGALGLEPVAEADLDQGDVAEVIGFVASRPSYVNLDLIVIRPRDQASASRFSRRAGR
jgi:NADP-dependent 3-hydroxy acid dehydrogenase YdfG